MRLLVTGGASGLGRAVALGAGERGAKVVVADIDKVGAEAVGKACGGHALAVDLIKGDAEQAVEDGASCSAGSTCWSTTPATAPARRSSR